MPLQSLPLINYYSLQDRGVEIKINGMSCTFHGSIGPRALSSDNLGHTVLVDLLKVLILECVESV